METHGDWILQGGRVTGRLNNNGIKNKQKRQLTRLTGKHRRPGNRNSGNRITHWNQVQSWPKTLSHEWTKVTIVNYPTLN